MLLMKLIRRPRPSTVQHQIVLDEVKAAMTKLGDDTVKQLEADIAEWETQPEFTSVVKVTKKRWTFVVGVDRRTKAGKIYTWVDKGTGERGDDPAGKAYDIFPKKDGGLLVFDVPYEPKTMPLVVPGKLEIDYGAVNSGPPASLALPMVHALGIRPRNFTSYQVAILKDRSNNKGFKRTIDNAIKRANYRIGKRAK